MLRWMMFGCVALLGFSEVASAATISAVLNPGYSSGKSGLVSRTVDNVLSEDFVGPITSWNPPAFQTVVFVNQAYEDGVALVRTDVSRQDASGITRIALTTYSNFYQGSGGTSTGGSVISYVVNNKGYWEFTVDGNYLWEIKDKDPALQGIGTNNYRTYSFVKVNGGTESILAANNTGKGSLNPVGSSALDSGVYRLYFHHYDSSKYTNGSQVNSVDLDIYFTLSGGGGGGGGVVPEPSSVAVFGLLSLGGAVARWRRKKSQLAA